MASGGTAPRRTRCPPGCEVLFRRAEALTFAGVAYSQCGEGNTSHARRRMAIDEMVHEALRLKAAERASVAHELLSSLESLSEAEIEQLWIDEALPE